MKIAYINTHIINTPSYLDGLGISLAFGHSAVSECEWSDSEM